MRVSPLLPMLLMIAGPVDPVDADDAPSHLAAFEGLPVTEITIDGHSMTKEYVIRREIETEIGDPLDLTAVQADLQRLVNLDIFGSVDVVGREHAGGVALDYTFREFPTFIPFLKVRYTEQDGWSIGPSISSVNLTGRAIKLSGYVLAGAAQTFSARFTYPWISGNHLSLDVIASRLDRDDGLNEFEETSTEVTPWVGVHLGRRGRLRGTVSYFQMRSDTDGKTLSPDNVDDLYRVGIAYGHDSRDSWLNPHSGWENEIQTLAYGGILGGDGSSGTLDIDLRRYLPVKRQTIMMGSLLSLQSGEVGTDVPEYLQYRMGGANSIRGYDIEKLGKTLFGKNQLITTIEGQILLINYRELRFFKWSANVGLEVALFADWGIAWSTSSELSLQRSKLGYGIGLRPLLPGIKVLRLDFGISENGDVRFHLGSGSKLVAQRQRIR